MAGVSVAYFYIKENEQQLRDPNAILKTLAWQIAANDPVFKKHAAEICSTKKNIISAEQTWLSMFVAFYQSKANADKSAMLVVDGLDEAPRAARSTLLGLFKGLLSENADGTRPHIQVAVIGRVTLKSDMDFEREETFIQVSRGKNQDDLDRYIVDRLSTLDIIKKLGELDKQEAKKPPGKQNKPQAPAAKRKLKDRISSYAEGVFLWAKLLLDQIHDKDIREIEKILSRPPSSLESMVKHVYERLSAEEDDLEPIKRLLMWTAYAQRPLLFGEIELILSLPSRAPNLLLWDKFQGKLASIYELSIPEHSADDHSEGPEEAGNATEDLPDDECEREVQQEEKGERNEVDVYEKDNEDVNSEQEAHYLSADEGSDENDHRSDTSGFNLLDEEPGRGLDALAMGELPDVAGEHLHAYADWQSKTRITFSHLQFREFLVPKGKKNRRPIDLDIDTERSQLEITITCLELLEYGFDVQMNSKYLIDYPCRFFVQHLEFVDPASIDEEDCYKIVRGIYWLFHEDRGAKSLFNAPFDSDSDMWDDYWTTWLATNTHTNSIRTWLSHAEI